MKLKVFIFIILLSGVSFAQETVVNDIKTKENTETGKETILEDENNKPDNSESEILEEIDKEIIKTPTINYMTIKVKKQDTLKKIAKRFKIQLSQLVKENPHIKNPDLIHPGETIYIPIEITEVKPALKEDIARKKEEEKQEIKKKPIIFDATFNTGFGFYYPVGFFGDRLNSSLVISSSVFSQEYTFWGITPEINFQKTELEGNTVNNSYTLEMIQILGGLSYRIIILQSSFFSGGISDLEHMSLYASLRYGPSIMHFASGRNYSTAMEHTLGIFMGFSYPVYKQFNTCIEAGYQYISAEGKPIQAIQMLLKFEYRFYIKFENN